MSVALPVKQHAALGASGASRWMACPGAPRMERGLPDYETDHSREGTAAHDLAEKCLVAGVDAITFLGTSIGGFEVTEEMAGFVQLYVDHCRDLVTITDEHWVERQFNLAKLNPPEPMFGTSDFVAYNRTTRQLYVVDLKYGQGVVVEVKDNKQLRYYGLGALLSLGDLRVDEVIITVVQPRASHPDGIVRSETVPILELIDFTGDLLAAARATLDPNAPLVPGNHCRFCKASAVCPAQMRQAQEIALVDFANLPKDVPPAPETLPPEVLGEILLKIPILEDWIKAMYQHAQRRLENGEPVPGMKLVEKRPRRYWGSEEQARRWLEQQGYGPDAILEAPKLKSVAQIEKVVGKKGMEEMPSDMVEKRSSGFTVAPRTDSRPEVTALTPQQEYAGLLAGDNRHESENI